MGPALRLLPPAPPAGAAGDLGHARRGRDLRAHRGGLRRAPHRGARALRGHRPRAAHALLALVPWGTMIYGRFVVPDGGPDALALHDRIWEDGMTAALDAGGVMNDHHGVGIKLGPYMRRQHGGALGRDAADQGRAGPQRRDEPRQDGPVGPEGGGGRHGAQGVHAQLDAARADRDDDRAARAQRLRRDRDLRRAGDLRRRPGQAPARRARARVLGVGDADDRRPRPRARGPLRAAGERPVRQGLPVARRLARRQDPHDRPVDGRQGRADGLARGGVELVRSRASRSARRTPRRSASGSASSRSTASRPTSSTAPTRPWRWRRTSAATAASRSTSST